MFQIDTDYLQDILLRLLAVPSPSGFTDQVVETTCAELGRLGLPFELTRRGAIRATLHGARPTPGRAIVGHIDTLGAMVKGLKDNGRLELVPIGTWAARFAEGARCTVFCDDGMTHRGTIMPLKASGHVFNEEVDSQPADWRNLELRVDALVGDRRGLEDIGIHIGDTVAIDPAPEVTETGFVASRHLDDKAGVAAMLAAVKAVRDAGLRPPVNTHLLFTIAEEVGVGASAVLHGDVAEMVSVDNGTIAPGQNTSEYGATITMQDSSGPFDRHLTRRLIALCRDNDIEHTRDVFRYYRSDAAAAVEAGNDIRTALVCFAVDGSHGWERTHLRSLEAVARLLALYMNSPPVSEADRVELGPRELPGD